MTNSTYNSASNLDKIRKLLQLCFLQAKLAVDTNEKDVDNLVAHFTRLVDLEQELHTKISNGQDCSDQMQELRQLISACITDFQFFDRLKQQVNNAVRPIRTWTENGELPDPFSEDFVHSYTTQEEKDIYSIVIQEDSLETAELLLEEMQKNKKEHDDDALLF